MNFKIILLPTSFRLSFSLEKYLKTFNKKYLNNTKYLKCNRWMKCNTRLRQKMLSLAYRRHFISFI